MRRSTGRLRFGEKSAALCQPIDPLTKRVLFVLGVTNHCAGAMHELFPHVGIAPFADTQ